MNSFRTGNSKTILVFELLRTFVLLLVLSQLCMKSTLTSVNGDEMRPKWSNTSSATPSMSFTPTMTLTESGLTPSGTMTETISESNEITDTGTASGPSLSITGSESGEDTMTDSPSKTGTMSASPSITNTLTQTGESPTNEITRSDSNSITVTQTFSPTITSTSTTTLTTTNTLQKTESLTLTRSKTMTASESNEPTYTGSDSQTTTMTASGSLSLTILTLTPSTTDTLMPTMTETLSRTFTSSSSISDTPTATITGSLSNDQSKTDSDTPSTTLTLTVNPTSTPTALATETRSTPPTRSTTLTPSSSVTTTVSMTATASSTETSTMSLSQTQSKTESLTATFSASNEHSSTGSSTQTVSMTPTATTTLSFSPSVTSTVAVTPTGTLTVSASNEPTSTDSASVTGSLSPSASNEASSTGSSSVTMSLTPTTTTTLSMSPSSTVSLSVSISPPVTASASISSSGTQTVTASPSVTVLPTESPTLAATTSTSETTSMTPSSVLSETPSLSSSSSLSISTSRSVGSMTPSLSKSIAITQSLTPPPTASMSISGTHTLSSTSSGTYTVSTSLSETTTPTITISGTTTQTQSISIHRWTRSAPITDTMVTLTVTQPTYTSSDSMSPSGSDTNEYTSSGTMTMSDGTPSPTVSSTETSTYSNTNSAGTLTLTYQSSSWTQSETHMKTASPPKTTTTTVSFLTYSESPTGTLSPEGTISESASGEITMSDSPTATTTTTMSGTNTQSITESLSGDVTYSGSDSKTGTFSERVTASTDVTPSAPITKTKTKSKSVSMTFSTSLSPDTTSSVSLTQSYPSPSNTVSHSVSQSKSDSPTISASLTETGTPSNGRMTNELTLSKSGTFSDSPSADDSTSNSLTPSVSMSPTITDSMSNDISASNTITLSLIVTPTALITPTDTMSFTTGTYAYSLSPTTTGSMSQTKSDSMTGSSSEVITKSADVTPTHQQTKTLTPTSTAAVTATHTPTQTKSETFTNEDTLSGSYTSSISTTGTQTSTFSNTETASDSATQTKSFTVSETASGPSLTPSLTQTTTESLSASQSLTETPTGTHPKTTTASFTSTRSLTPTSSVPVSDTDSLTETITLSPSGTMSKPSRSVTLTVTMSKFSPSFSHTGPTFPSTLTTTQSMSGPTTSSSYSRSLTVVATPSFTTTFTISNSDTRTRPSYSGSADVTLTYTGTQSRGSASMSATVSYSLTEPSPSRSETILPTSTESIQPTDSTTITLTPSDSPYPTPTATYPTPTVTAPTPTATLPTPSATGPTPTITVTLTPTTTMILSESDSVVPTDTPTVTYSLTPTFSDSMSGPSLTLSGFTDSLSPSNEPTGSQSLSLSKSQTPTFGTITLTPTETLLQTPSDTVLPTATPSWTQTATYLPTDTPTDSNTVRPTDTLSGVETMTATPTYSAFTPSPTVSYPASTTLTITPPPTDTKSLTKTVSESITTTISGGTDSLSPTISRLTLSPSEEDSMSVTYSTSRSGTYSTTESMSPTITLTETIQVFTADSDYITSPKSTTDVLPIHRMVSFSLINSPAHADGDMAGLVPTTEGCSTVDPVSGLEVKNPKMQSLTYRGPRIPSNWSITMPTLGTFEVCAYQQVIGRWVKINPTRSVSFGAVFFPQYSGYISPKKMPAGNVLITLPMVGADSGDIVRLIQYGKSCQSAVPSTFLLVSGIWPDVAQVSGSAPIAGDYAMCYKGYPQWKSLTYFIYAPFRIYGIATGLKIHTPMPAQSNAWLNITVFGTGMALIDSWYLAKDSTCLSRVATPIIRTRSPSKGLTAVNMMVQATKSGDLVMCYKSNFSAYPTALTGTISVSPIVANTVIPANETYAQNTHVMLTILGDLLSPTNDNASLHLASDCKPSNFKVPLVYNGSLWLAAVNTSGTYTVCYGTNSTDPRPVLDKVTNGEYQVYVVPLFYHRVQEFWIGSSLNSNFSTNIIGWGLNPSIDAVWIQPRSQACAVKHSTLSVTPYLIENRTVSIVTKNAGYMQLCYITNQNVVLASADVLPVQPQVPTSFGPTQGLAQSLFLASLFGSTQFDLTQGDKVGLCSSSSNYTITSFLNVTGSLTFSFNPPAIGDYHICVASRVIIHDNQTTVYSYVGKYNALPAIKTITTVPTNGIEIVTKPISIQVTGVGLDKSDKLYLCALGTTTDLADNSSYTLTRDSTNFTKYTVTFIKSIKASVCYTFGTASGSISIIPEIVGEPALEILVPAIIYAGQSQYTGYSGLALDTLSSVYINTAGLACNDTTATFYKNITFPLNLTGKSLWVDVPNRGTYAVCYTGLTKYGFTAISSLQVVSRMVTMTPVDLTSLYGGCAMQIKAVGNGLLMTDGFYLSTYSSCLSKSQDLIPTDKLPNNQTFDTMIFDVTPALTDTQYYMCYAPQGNVMNAVMRGTFKAQAPFSITKDNSTGYRIQHRCSYIAGASYVFQLQTEASSGSTEWIPLDLSLNSPVLTIGHLPFRYFKVRMITTKPDKTTAVSEMTTSLQATTSYCLTLPSSVTPGVSTVKQFAEVIFILMNFLELNCKSLGTAKSNPTPIVTKGQELLGADPTLLTDPVTMLPTLGSTLPATNDPVQDAVTLLNITVPNMKPYSPAKPGVVESHLGVVASALTILQSGNSQGTGTSSYTGTKQAALDMAFDRIHLAATVACASNQDLKVDYGVYATTIQKNLPMTSSGLVLVGVDTQTTIIMSGPSTEGYCFSVTTMPVKLLQRIRRRQTTSAPNAVMVATPSDIDTFNLPLFSIMADPLKTDGTAPTIKEASIAYSYPSTFGPAALPATAIADIFTYSRADSSWYQEQNVITTVDTSARILNFNVSSPKSNGVLLSGTTTWHVNPKAKNKKVIDWLLIVMTCVLMVSYIVVIILSRIRDTNMDSTPGPHLETLQRDLSKPSLAWHRWLVVFKRVPQHPVSTMERVVMAMTYLAALLLFSIFIASRSNEKPGTMAIGLVSGLVAALLATPVATLVRIPLALQLKDKASFVAALLALIISIPVSFLSTFGIAAAVAVVAGLVAGGVTAFVIRDSWSLRTQPRPGPVPALVGGGLAGVTMLLAVVFGFYKGIVSLLPQDNRDSYLVLSTFLWGALLDGLILEPIKHYAVPYIAKRFNGEEPIMSSDPSKIINDNQYLPSKAAHHPAEMFEGDGRYIDEYHDPDQWNYYAGGDPYDEIPAGNHYDDASDDAVSHRSRNMSMSKGRDSRIMTIEDDFEEVQLDEDQYDDENSGLQRTPYSRPPSEVDDSDIGEYTEAVAPVSVHTGPAAGRNPLRQQHATSVPVHQNPMSNAFDPYGSTPNDGGAGNGFRFASNVSEAALSEVGSQDLDPEMFDTVIDFDETSYEAPEPQQRAANNNGAKPRIQDYYV